MTKPRYREMRFPFTIEQGGKTYDCERIVTGKRVFRQIVHVAGLGTKEDSAPYNSPFGGSIAAIARIIAHEIVGESVTD